MNDLLDVLFDEMWIWIGVLMLIMLKLYNKYFNKMFY